MLCWAISNDFENEQNNRKNEFSLLNFLYLKAMIISSFTIILRETVSSLILKVLLWMVVFTY